MKTFKLCLNQFNTDGVTFMVLDAATLADAIAKAVRCLGNDWFVATVEFA